MPESGELIDSAELHAALVEAQQRHPTVGQVSGWDGPPAGFMTNPAELRRYRARKKADLSVAHRDTGDLLHPPAVPERDAVPVRDDGGPPMVQIAAEAPTGLVRNTARYGSIPHLLPEAVRGMSLQLDIGVERRRSFWWRLALRLAVRRLR
jgi:hypothetical protein